MFVPLAGTEAKFAVICGKKVGKAPIRNKVRRRLREVCRLTLASSVPPASQIVIRALPGSAGSPYAKLEAEAVALVSRLTRNVVTSNG
jgi:ribonuclease P protein component